MSTINYTVTVLDGEFLIDSGRKPALTFREGSTYVFDQSDSSNSGNTLRFSETLDGTHDSGSEYTTGVSVTGTAGNADAKTTIVCDASTASTLYYYSDGNASHGDEFSDSGYTETGKGGFLKPIVGGAAEKWGPMVNHTFDQIAESIFSSNSAITDSDFNISLL